ncbi:hypothetical protein NMY22_g18674 [Coprinellus aureogranulatus]|nr:hypothetical protein NMY22_g18674 [Coprinellus aureogranulatus]
MEHQNRVDPGDTICDKPADHADNVHSAESTNPFRRPISSISWGATEGPTREAETSDCTPLDPAEGGTSRKDKRCLRRPDPLFVSPGAPPSSPPATFSTASSATRFSGDGFYGSGQDQNDLDALAHQVDMGALNASPVQELPFRRAEDRNVAAPCRATPFDGLAMSESIERLVAVNASEYERYKRGYCYPLSFHKPEKDMIHEGPVATSFERPALPGWCTYVHPEGTRYFYHDDCASPVPVITEAWLYDDEVRSLIEQYIKDIFAYLNVNGIDFRVLAAPCDTQLSGHPRDGGDDWEYIQDSTPVVLVLETRLSGYVGYYFVDHHRQRLFWLDKFDFTYEVGEVNIDHENSSLGLEMKNQYWTHIEFFPHLYELTDKDIIELDDMIAFTFGDALTSETSAVNSYSLNDLKLAQEIMNRHEHKARQGRRQSVGERRTICEHDVSNLSVRKRFVSRKVLELTWRERCTTRLETVDSLFRAPTQEVDHQVPSPSPGKKREMVPMAASKIPYQRTGHR